MEQVEAGKSKPSAPVVPSPACQSRRAPGEVQGGGVWLDGEPGRSHSASLVPVLRAALGPKPFHATKEGGASSLAIQPHREDQRWAGRGRQGPATGATSPQIQAKKPVWPGSLLPIGSLQAGTGARWM